MMYTVRPATLADTKSLPDIERSAGTLFRTCGDGDLAILADDEPISAKKHLVNIEQWRRHGFGDGGTWVAVVQSLPEVVVGFVVSRLVPVQFGHPRSVAGEMAGSEQPEEEDVSVIERNTGDAKQYFIHIDELSVHENHQRRGLARKLVGVVQDTARLLTTRTGSDVRNKWTLADDQRVRIVGVTLTTMRDVLFNKPFYEKLGFCEAAGGVEEIAKDFGDEAVTIWEDDLETFRNKSDRKLARRRCWMSWFLAT